MIAAVLGASLLGPGHAPGATRSDVRDAVARAADRLAAIRSFGRTWEDAPYLVGLLLLAADRESLAPGSGRLPTVPIWAVNATKSPPA